MSIRRLGLMAIMIVPALAAYGVPVTGNFSSTNPENKPSSLMVIPQEAHATAGVPSVPEMVGAASAGVQANPLDSKPQMANDNRPATSSPSQETIVGSQADSATDTLKTTPAVHELTAKAPVRKNVSTKTAAKRKVTVRVVAASKSAVLATKPVEPQITAEKDNGDGFVSRFVTATKGLVNTAFGWMGTRYRWGGLSANGVDCSGLTKILYKKQGIDLPRTAKQQYKQGQPVAREALLPGDLVFFNTSRGPITHVGLYIGNGEFVHAANPHSGVRKDRLDSAYFDKKYAGARRYKDFG